MNRCEQLRYDFPTEKNLEVRMRSGVWVRVTCDTFRSYYGPRRINEETYDGLYYYKDTNFPYIDVEEYTYRDLLRSDYKSKVGKNYNPIKRCF